MKRHNPVLLLLMLWTFFILSACGGGDSSSQPFSQADLVGTWYINILQTGPAVTSGEPGWMRGTADIDSTGHITITSFATSAAGTVLPADYPQGIVWTIDPATGMITETGTPSAGNPDFHGKLAANKQLIVGTATNQNASGGVNTAQLRIIQKIDPSVTYNADDLANKDFMMHQLSSGANDDWAYASGSTDVNGTATMPTMTTSSLGSIPGGTPGIIAVQPDTGLVTLDTNTSFEGMLSSDKTYFVATETDQGTGDIYRLTIVQILPSNPSFVTSDLAGSWHFHGLATIPAWVYEGLSIDASGLATITSQLDSAGTSTNDPIQVQLGIDSAGNVVDTGDATLHGTLSAGKDMIVTTQTLTGTSYNMLGVAVK
ncbi:MAG: hypothetical protein P8130_07355 [Deltaproteobacteria bacterium]